MRCYSTLGLTSNDGHNGKLAAAIDHLAQSWDASQDDLEEAADNTQRESISELIKRLENPDIGLPLTVSANTSSPRDLEGMVPWEYIEQKYPNLPCIVGLSMWQTDEGKERAKLAIRIVLTRTPEKAWGDTHVQDVVARAVQEAVGG